MKKAWKRRGEEKVLGRVARGARLRFVGFMGHRQIKKQRDGKEEEKKKMERKSSGRNVQRKQHMSSSRPG